MNVMLGIIGMILKIVFGLVWMILPIVIIVFSIKRTANKAIEENMSKIDFIKEKDYYRDILKGYSPAELCYIDNFKIQIPREIVAILLNLKLKQRIEIHKDKIDVINSNLDGLKKTEKFVLQNIKDGKVKIDNSGYIESFAQDEAIEDNLIKKNEKEVIKKRIIKKILKQVFKIIILIVLFAIMCINIEKINQIDNGVLSFMFFLLMLGFSLYLFYCFVVSPWIMITYLLMQTNSYSRTEKGEELNKKIEGLKQYIMDYSLLDEKEQEALTLWDEYLIYSVIFDINLTTIVEDISNLIEIDFQYGKIYFEKKKG